MDPAACEEHTGARPVNAVVRWFAPVLPEARVAILRTVLYAFVLLDIHLSSATRSR